MKNDFKDRDFLREQENAARQLRAAKGFAGFESPLASIQKKMLLDFQESASIKHSGDSGAARENILRDFFTKHPYLPKRYEVSSGSSHVVATDGSISSQMDLVIFDALDTPRLLDIGQIQYFPIESVYGTIQVKSDLNSDRTIREGLDNLASFKTLNYASGDPSRGFGILFAYDAGLKWATLVDALKGWEADHPSALWPNMVVVLNQGLVLNVAGGTTVLLNDEIAKITKPDVWPVIGDDAALVHFYMLLMDVLGATKLPRVPLRRYVNLPQRSGARAVRFIRGSHSEVAECEKHGSYLRELRAGAVEEILAACADGQLVDAAAAMDEAYGKETKRTGSWGYTYMFNPDSLPMSKALLFTQMLMNKDTKIRTSALGFEELEIDGKRYWIPHYYDMKFAFIAGCPDCAARKPMPDLTIDGWHQYWDERANRAASDDAASTPAPKT